MTEIAFKNGFTAFANKTGNQYGMLDPGGKDRPGNKQTYQKTVTGYKQNYYVTTHSVDRRYTGRAGVSCRVVGGGHI